MKILLRGIRQRESDAGVIERCVEGEAIAATFEELLRIRDYPHADPVLTWDDLDAAAAVDVDMPDGVRLDERILYRVSSYPDQPAFTWLTHGGGLRAVFFAGGGLSAVDRAALFAFLFVKAERIPSKRVELKRETRHPGYARSCDNGRCGKVTRGSLIPNVAGAAAWVLGDDVSVTDEQAEAWRQENGFTLGTHYEHARCPISPTEQDHGKPVVPLDAGVYCHYCASSGRGFVRYTDLIEPEKRRRRKNPVKQCARGMAHWEHAKRVIEAETGWVGKPAEQLFRALLNAAHLVKCDGDEKRESATRGLINSVFFPPAEILRGPDWWYRLDMKSPSEKTGLHDIISSLPAVRFVDDKGKIGTCIRRRGFLQQGGDVAEYGYPALIPVRGVDFGWRDWCDAPEENGVRFVIPADPPFRMNSGNLARAEEHVRKHFPGVNLGLLRLLIAGKGVVQLGSSESSMVMLYGQSGAAKTAHVLLASEIACDHVTTIDIGKNFDDFMMQAANATRAGCFAFLDEVAKPRGIDRMLTERLLALKRGRTYRPLYAATAELPARPLIVMADTVVPSVLRSEVQLARRVVDVDLGAGVNAENVDWRQTCNGDIVGWRGRSPENAEAADIILSDVIRNYAEADFLKIAQRLGFTSFRDSVGDIDANADHKAFFAAVCQAPDDDTARGRGYKRIDLGRETAIEKAFFALVGGNIQGFYPDRIQTLTGAQWGNIVGVPGVELDFTPRHKHAFVRFRVGKAQSRNVRVNGEILNPPTVSGIVF